MATEKKSIEISYKANLADLKAKLKTIPNITDAEAKKMVAALDRQLKQAEKAAKKSADASKKAAKEAAMAARKGSSDFDKMGAAAARAEKRLEGVADASGDIDRGFSSVGLALRGVNPQLAEAADGLADAFAVGEGLLLTFTSLNPIVVAAGAAIGALTLGFVAYTDSIEKAREKTIAMRDAQKSLSEQYQEIGKNLEDARKKLGDQRDSLDIATGAISEYDAALLQASKTAEQSFQGNIDAQKRIIKERQDDLKLIERIISGDKAISDSEKERIRNLQLITKNSNNNLDILANGR